MVAGLHVRMGSTDVCAASCVKNNTKTVYSIHTGRYLTQESILSNCKFPQFVGSCLTDIHRIARRTHSN